MSVQVIHGANVVFLPLSGRTVGRVKSVLRDVLNVSRRAVAFIQGKPVADDHLLADGDVLEFVRAEGHKGGDHDHWSEKELVRFVGADNVQRMKDNGLVFELHPTLTSDEVISWNKWLHDSNHDPANTLNVQVSVVEERIVVCGTEYHIDMELAAIVECLVEAKGEIRSQDFMKRKYKGLLMGKLDRLINKKLKSHPSGIGKHIKGEKGKGYRLLFRTA